MQAGAFQTDGSAVRRHPDLEVLDVPGQLRAGRGEGVAQIAHPEVRREAADVLAHLEDALFDAEAGFLLVDPVDPAHLLRNTEQFSLSGKVLFQVSVHAHGHFGQRGICRQRQLALEGCHAVVEGVRRTQRVAGVCRVAVEHLVLVQIRPHRLTEQGREGTERLDAAAEGGVHKPRLFQPDAAAGGRLFKGLHHGALHIVGHLTLGVLCKDVLDVVGRVRLKGLALESRAVPQVAVELQHHGHEGCYAPAIGQKVEPVKVDDFSLIAQGNRKAVLVRKFGLCAALPHRAGGVRRLEVEQLFLPHRLLEIVGCLCPGRVQSLLQKRAVHGIFQRDLIAAVDHVFAVIVNDTLKNRALFGIHSLFPRVCGQIVGQIADGDEVAQLLFGDAQAESLLQVGDDGQDLHGRQVQIVHQDAVLVDIIGGNFCNIFQNCKDLGHDLGSFHSLNLPFVIPLKAAAALFQYSAAFPVYSYLRSSLPVPVRGRGSVLNSTALIRL